MGGAVLDGVRRDALRRRGSDGDWSGGRGQAAGSQHIMLRVRPKSTWRRTTRYACVAALIMASKSQGLDAGPTNRNLMM